MAADFTLDQCSAIITGASSGLGEEFARQLAPRARSLLLVARRESELLRVKAELCARHPALSVQICACDVTTDTGRMHVAELVDVLDLKPNVLINNAGMGDYGTFASASAERLRAQVDLNITALLLLTHALLPALSANVPAGILNVSSLAGQAPLPEVAVYAASKAFVTSFTEALRIELAGKGVRVSALCPGPTPTHFSKTARREDGEDTNRSGQGMLRVPPKEVVRAGLEGLEDDRALVFPGAGVRVAASVLRVMPRAWLRWGLRRRSAR